ncbi:DUF4142 domain-containing protein [Pontibacter akesuensis]|uniref:DUF4142 domain-containing protein n=1 Tax=Pontibacter akesuensis TaxID=388950 RepID=A0A1I7IFV1_9BACT|nr:DUF4142 domain-containing protein [Pontibacter akesuensis]GHA66990.1 hypothetical protein GCM10007389_20130 [Pontibacter akesuensis]SFU71805.1 protein of unknown function [Pontibacter akesuensis]
MLLDRIIAFTLGTIFLLVLACDGPAAEKSEAIAETRTRTLLNDPAFWDYAASSNMLQVQVSELAVEKATNARTREFAQNVTTYHADALKQLENLVAGHDNIRLPDSLGGADQGLLQDMALLEGEAFDLRYREFVLSTHHAQLNRYEEALVKADDQKTREWIINLREHLREKINQISEPDSAAL